MANYLVTGGAGFIGSNIVDYLVEQGESVRVLDSFLTGRRSNLERSIGRVELIEGDIRDRDAVDRAVEDMDYVIHLAALPSVPRSVEDPVGSSEINVMGTINVLDACVRAKVRRVVYAASSSAYGDQPVAVKVETLMPAPLSPYAAAKLAGEAYLKAFYESYGLETVALRYFNIFGPRQDPNSPYSAVVPRFVTAVLQGRAPVIYGDGGQSRDFTHIQNVINANIMATRAPKEACGRVFNVACGEAYSLLDLLGQISKLLGVEVAPIHEPGRTGDVRHSLADIGLAKELLGYKVDVDFTEGLRRTVEWYKAEHAAAGVAGR